MAKAGFSRRPELPCPTAQAPADFAKRLEGLTYVHRRRRVLAEGGGADWGTGRGQDFVGYRPYRAGEDARALDFALLARLGKPFVRVTRPEAHQTVTLLLDRSASMAVGPPGKWQSAVEIALAFAHAWTALGAEVRVLHGEAGRPVESRELRRARDWGSLANELFGLRADQGLGLRELLPAMPATCDRVILLGDLFDLETADLQPRLRGQTQWSLIRILSELEANPPQGTHMLWLDPEADSEPIASGSLADRQAYLERLAAFDARWHSWCSHHRVVYRTHLAGRPFEEAFPSSGGPLGGAL